MRFASLTYVTCSPYSCRILSSSFKCSHYSCGTTQCVVHMSISFLSKDNMHLPQNSIITFNSHYSCRTSHAKCFNQGQHVPASEFYHYLWFSLLSQNFTSQQVFCQRTVYTCLRILSSPLILITLAGLHMPTSISIRNNMHAPASKFYHDLYISIQESSV